MGRFLLIETLFVKCMKNIIAHLNYSLLFIKCNNFKPCILECFLKKERFLVNLFWHFMTPTSDFCIKEI